MTSNSIPVDVTVKDRVSLFVQSALAVHNPKRRQHSISSSQKLTLSWLTALRQAGTVNDSLKIKLPKLIRWICPPLGRLKLNIDGAFKPAGSAGGGGILRDRNGDMSFAFSQAYHSLNSNLQSEALALRDGLKICCSKGIQEVLVETDSLNLVHIISGQQTCPWDLLCILQDVAITAQQIKAEIKHVPREANQEANCLAGLGCSSNKLTFRDSCTILPLVVKGTYHLDKVGCPTLRL
ncbi:hypothetical protein Taro_024639 [Colocasia esculenta]|uniref:RNase H type-1 domain-containing protein n=1 Tax=Colocasia esculenta TaxID=4460 RepID=A0A843V9Y2_COLES|nr:hypothetical protein [Colocasia esculenta]